LRGTPWIPINTNGKFNWLAFWISPGGNFALDHCIPLIWGSGEKKVMGVVVGEHNN